jgi:hypothetical protein
MTAATGIRSSSMAARADFLHTDKQIVSVSGAGARMRGDRDSRRASTAVVPLALHIAGISSAGVRVRLVLVRPPDESGKACYDELSLVSLAKLTKGRIDRCAGLHGLRASLESCS